MADVCLLFEGDTDDFTLAGLDDDWESIDLQPSLTVGPEHCFLDELGYMSLDLDASSAGFFHHAGDFSRHHDLGAALDQPVLDLDSEADEMGGEEMVLDF